MRQGKWMENRGRMLPKVMDRRRGVMRGVEKEREREQSNGTEGERELRRVEKERRNREIEREGERESERERVEEYPFPSSVSLLSICSCLTTVLLFHMVYRINQLIYHTQSLTHHDHQHSNIY